MYFQESAKRLEQLSEGFKDATTSLTQIYSDLKLVRSIEISNEAPCSVKYAASAAIIADVQEAMREACTAPDNLDVAVQLVKIKDKVRIGLAGGAVISDQERDWIADPANLGKATPPNLFYILAQEQLSKGEFNFSYDLDLASSGFTRSLRANLLRELSEELGSDAAEQVTFGTFLPEERTTTLSTITLPDAQASQKIAEELAGRGVGITDKGALTGIYTVVTEKVAVAHAPLDKIEATAEENSEAKGMRVKSLGELLQLSKQSSASVESYQNFKRLHSDRHGSDGIRNPSTTWGLRLLTEWLRDKVIEADPYREGPRGPVKRKK
ncbi:MAG: hypothetical protein GX589_09690 [Deltaproteobacteria bacterium]|nr:hypothetical protein [Deltaproteobacteria bacterium]